MMEIILASQSPRRRELLGRIVPSFRVVVTEADEVISHSVTPDEFVTILARRKAEAAACEGAIVIGADTVVVCDGAILGKPKNREEAAEMLSMLSGRSHFVYTGVAVCCDGRVRTAYEKTEVVFDALSPDTIRAYIETGEPMDKAGSYGIQEKGACLVR